MCLTYYFTERELLYCLPVTSCPEMGGQSFHYTVVNQMRNFPDKAKRLQNKNWSYWRGKWLRDQEMEYRMGRNLFAFYWNTAWGLPYRKASLGLRTGWSRHYGYSL